MSTVAVAQGDHDAGQDEDLLEPVVDAHDRRGGRAGSVVRRATSATLAGSVWWWQSSSSLQHLHDRAEPVDPWCRVAAGGADRTDRARTASAPPLRARPSTSARSPTYSASTGSTPSASSGHQQATRIRFEGVDPWILRGDDDVEAVPDARALRASARRDSRSTTPSRRPRAAQRVERVDEAAARTVARQQRAARLHPALDGRGDVVDVDAGAAGSAIDLLRADVADEAGSRSSSWARR